MSGRFRAAVALSGFVFLSGGVALAQQPAQAPPTAAEKDAARALMGEGEEKRERGDLEGALKSFQAADTIMHVPTTGLEVAKAEIALGKLMEAHEMLLSVLRSPVKRNEPRPFAQARESAKALNEELDRRIPSVVIQLADAPSSGSASVTLDGAAAAVGTARRVNPGHHVITAQAGDAWGRAEVDVAEHEVKTVTLKLSTAAEPPASTPATPEGPKPAPAPAPGTGGNSTAKYIGYTGFGVGAAGIAVGAITGIIVLGKSSDLEDACNKPGGAPNTCTGDDADALSSTKTLATVSTVAFVAGAVGLTVGVVSLFFGKSTRGAQGSSSTSSAAKAGPSVEPWIGPGSAGLTGRF